MQQRHLSSLASPGKPLIRTVRSHRRPRVPSRTSSQRRTLNRFTRQLEKYADATGAKGKAPVVTPTESESRFSLYTVKPLLPYHKEFQSAGLAVTSSEQLQTSPARPRSRTQQPKKRLSKNVPPAIGGKLDGQDDHLCNSKSTSTGSYIQFIHPDEPAAYLIDPLPQPKSRSKPKLRCSEGLKLPWLRAKPTVTKPSESKRDSTGQGYAPKDGHRRSQPQAQAEESGPSVPNIPKTHGRAQTAQSNKHTPTRQPDKTCRHSADVIATKHAKQPALQPEKRMSHPRNTVCPPKLPCGDVAPAKPRECVHRSCRKLETIPSEIESLPIRPPPKHPLHCKRVVTSRPLLHTEAIQEEKGPVLPVKPMSKQEVSVVPHKVQHKVQHEASPQTNTSSVPSLPSVAMFATNTESSLERALDAVMNKLDEMETKPAQQVRPYPTATLQEKTNRSKPLPTPKPGTVTLWPPQPDKLGAEDHKNTQRPSMGRRLNSPLLEPSRKSSAPRQSGLSSKGKTSATAQGNYPLERNDSAPATKAAPNPTERVLDDLDGFFDHDDAAINDKDVLQGLQVAVHAAADDFYDAYIRYKTGMRIRRFLADLKSVDVLQRENMLDQVPARQAKGDGKKRPD